MRDIRWMLRCVDIDDGKALKSKTGRIELWLSEDLTLLNVCDRERFATARILFIHEWWDIVDGNFTLATWSVKNCIAWTRILLNFFKVFIATVGWVAGNLCLLYFIGREYASSFYLLRTIFVGSFGVRRIRRSFDYVVDPTVKKMMCVVAMYDDVFKTCAEMEDFVWNFGHRVVRGESSISSSLFLSSFSFLFSLFLFLSLFRFSVFSAVPSKVCSRIA